ncbi:1-aminocyclopropane-1-carboxylate deaminase [Pedobacter sp. BAL39]|uniref:1-aminocyclopropane-1-carboxylate deaminase/D-cysteine desulfhydrase n=1 Tax=Pedobacter sp. BAL39 TaxID=391596 RepID=UPI000155B25D|nr:pyridoxal-phosphate dependent enzyme [Pedobacter sp. BAL39]EDM34271.1 1-aminocyclopropane-1-carboxylate deaminase [Pedobacter sp. BAL39]
MFTDIYSPLQQLKHTCLQQYWIKRDDLIDPYISGNKWRKLKYILEKASHLQRHHLVTFGGAYSNHLVATAAAAARSGLKSTAFVRGENVNNEILTLCKLYGMKLLFTDRTAYRNKHLLFEQHFSNDPDAIYVDEGGAGIEAVRGCAEIIDELPEDTAHLFCAAGTGTTGAGLLQGILKHHRKTKLHVIPVLKGAEFIREEIIKYTGESDQLIMHYDYHFGGYAKTTSELISFIKAFVAQHGVLLDPVYTAKMCFAIEDLQQAGEIRPEERIVALHTGGLLGLMGMKEKF